MTLDLEAIRQRLASASGPEYWRSLEELADSEEFRKYLEHEWPHAPWPETVNRRQMLRQMMRLMGASLALAGLTGCTKQPEEKIVPYVEAPENIVPGKPLYFATAMQLGGYATGLLVESHMGRPTKIEGNPDHPASLGATDAIAQASILDLYDPERSQVVTHRGRISSWVSFLGAVRPAIDAQRANRGAGIRILTETITSPTLAEQIRGFLREFPQAKWVQWEPAGRDNVRAGAQMAFGQPLNTIYRFDRADVVLSLDADFLATGPGAVRYARDFANRRSVHASHAAPGGAERAGLPLSMNRLYVVESTPSNTGAKADHRLPLRASEIESFARAVAGTAQARPEHAKWVAAVAKDLQAHRGASIVIAGDTQPPAVHALAHVMNATLGNVGSTVLYTDPIEANPADQLAALRELLGEMRAGKVEILLIIDGNPVFSAPVDLTFTEALKNVKLRVHLGLYVDETAAACERHVPSAHYLESWGDTRALDGTVTIQQPLIAPLYGGKSAIEFIAALRGQGDRNAYDLLRDYWRTRLPGADFEDAWQTALHNGVVPNTAAPVRKTAATQSTTASEPQPTGALEIIFRPDPHIWDGRFANNGWLQELPRPLTKITWDNVAMFSPATAQQLGINSEDLIELRYRGRSVRAPAWVMPGHPNKSVTVHFGFGRTHGGRVGRGVGFNAYTLRTSDAPWFGAGLEVRKTGERYTLATTQQHHSMEGRNIVRSGTFEQFQKHPEFVHEMGHAPGLSLYPDYKYEGYAWGMSIDMTRCVGCNACVAACNAENNIPIVGKDQVYRGRELLWIRVDRYYSGSLENPRTHFQPLPCMHCENAPCEVVCPVNATVHGPEGLNEMIYNRCVGTRYCSNNCPYKVRRFNFYLYADLTTPSLKLMRNPDVTVRTRGVMEKCTYCVQRINAARIDAKKEDRRIRDGEVLTACQQVCPAEAIIFGDINDQNSRVARLKADPRNYGVLEDLNTRPRTTYLAELRNPNPELA